MKKIFLAALCGSFSLHSMMYVTTSDNNEVKVVDKSQWSASTVINDMLKNHPLAGTSAQNAISLPISDKEYGLLKSYFDMQYIPKNLETLSLLARSADKLEIDPLLSVLIDRYAQKLVKEKNLKKCVKEKKFLEKFSLSSRLQCLITHKIQTLPSIEAYKMLQIRQLNTLTGHKVGVTALAITEDGKFASGSADGTIKIWDIAQNCCLSTFGKIVHMGGLWALAMMPDGKIVSGYQCNNGVKIWDKEQQKCLYALSHKASSLAITSDKKIISGSVLEDSIKIWDPQTQQCVSTLNCPKFAALAVAPDGKIVSSSSYGIDIWDNGQSQRILDLNGQKKIEKVLAVAPDGTLVSGGEDGAIKIWDLRQRKCLHIFKGHSGIIGALVIAPDGKIISGAADCTIKLWDKERGYLHTLNHNTPILALAATSDGKIISGTTLGDRDICDVLQIWGSPINWEQVSLKQCLNLLAG